MKTTKETETPCNVIASMKMSCVFFFFFVIKYSFTLGYLELQRGQVSKETVLLRRWGELQDDGFIN